MRPLPPEQAFRAIDDEATLAFSAAAIEPLRAAGYEVIRIVASGAKARVYRARKAGGGCDLALRIYKPAAERMGFHGGMPSVGQYRQLIRRLGEGHPNVAALLGAGAVSVALKDGRHRIPFSVMEMVEGPSLRDVIESGELAGLGLRAGMDILLGIVAAVEFLRGRGLRHGDVWPQNVILSRAADGRTVPKLIDLVPRKRRLIQLFVSRDPRHNDHLKMHMTLAAALTGKWDRQDRDVRIDDAQVLKYWGLAGTGRDAAVAELCRLVESVGPSGEMFERETPAFREKLAESAAKVQGLG